MCGKLDPAAVIQHPCHQSVSAGCAQCSWKPTLGFPGRFGSFHCSLHVCRQRPPAAGGRRCCRLGAVPQLDVPRRCIHARPLASSAVGNRCKDPCRLQSPHKTQALWSSAMCTCQAARHHMHSQRRYWRCRWTAGSSTRPCRRCRLSCAGLTSPRPGCSSASVHPATDVCFTQTQLSPQCEH